MRDPDSPGRKKGGEGKKKKRKKKREEEEKRDMRSLHGCNDHLWKNAGKKKANTSQGRTRKKEKKKRKKKNPRPRLWTTELYLSGQTTFWISRSLRVRGIRVRTEGKGGRRRHQMARTIFWGKSVREKPLMRGAPVKESGKKLNERRSWREGKERRKRKKKKGGIRLTRWYQSFLYLKFSAQK